MVQFGKRMAEAVQGSAHVGYYVNYKQLKKLIKVLKVHSETSGQIAEAPVKLVLVDVDVNEPLRQDVEAVSTAGSPAAASTTNAADVDVGAEENRTLASLVELKLKGQYWEDTHLTLRALSKAFQSELIPKDIQVVQVGQLFASYFEAGLNRDANNLPSLSPTTRSRLASLTSEPEESAADADGASRITRYDA